MNRIEYYQISADEHRALYDLMQSAQCQIYDILHCIDMCLDEESSQKTHRNLKSITYYLNRLRGVREVICSIEKAFEKNNSGEIDLVTLSKNRKLIYSKFNDDGNNL